MTRHLARRLLLVLTFVGLGLVGPLPLGSTAAGASGAPCSGRTGVTVVVDFGPLPGGTQQACVPDGSGRNAAVVTDAGGFRIDFTNDGQPFVCRISGQPDANREKCDRTPPDDAYWGLFWSDGTRSWTYSTQGATSLTPKDGWSIGWRFQDGGDRDLPSAGPRRDAAPSPSPSSSPSPTRRPSKTPSSVDSPSTGPTSAAPSSAAATGSTAAASPSGRASRTPTRSASPSETPSATDTTSPSETPTEQPSDDSTDDAGGSFATVTDGPDDGAGTGSDNGLAAVAGLLGLSALAGSAAFVAYRRGRS